MNSFTLRIGRNVSLVKVWALVCLVKSFFRILRENSVLLRALRGHFIREQHCCLHLILWCLIHRKRCYASPPSNIRLENSLKLEWCPGVQRSEQTSWSLRCLSCRKCTSTCLFLIWIENVQLPYVWSFRSKILHFRQNSAVDLRYYSREHI